MAVYRLVTTRQQFFDDDGAPLAGGQLFTYLAASSSKQATFSDSLGLVPNINPIVLDAAGRPTVEIWLTGGIGYKLILAPATDSDPPSSPIWTEDNIAGIDDATFLLNQTEWIASGFTPTFISASSFSVTSDKTAFFQAGRRLQIVDSGGTKYATTATSVFGALTVVTLTSAILASPMTSVAYGILSATNDSMPRGIFPTVANVSKHIYGLTYANNGTDNLDIAAGGAIDATGAYWMTGAALTKQTNVAWAVGSAAGMLDTGAVGNSDYYIWEIARPDTAVVDYLSSLSSTAPTMPANYVYKRLIGWFKRVGGVVASFTTYETEGGGLELSWNVPTLDINLANTLTTARRTDAVKVPLNFSTIALLNISMTDAAAGFAAWVYSPDTTDAAPSASAAPGQNFVSNAAGNVVSNTLRIRTSTAGLIAARATLATVDLYTVCTQGFTWARRN